MVSLNDIRPVLHPVVHHASEWNLGHNNWIVILIVIILIAFVANGLMGSGKH
jgi:hypothetical protein